MLHDQAVFLCCLFEPLVMIGASSGRVLDPMYIAVKMDHFMKQGGADVLDGSCQGPGSKVDLMGTAVDGNPGILSRREMPIDSGGTLDGDGGSCKCTLQSNVHSADQKVY